MQFNLDPRDAGRIETLLRERVRKLKRGLDKFAHNWDPVLGAPMKEAYEEHSRLLNEVIHVQEADRACRAGRHPA